MITLTVSAGTLYAEPVGADTVGVIVSDSIQKDTVKVDTITTKKRDNFFWKAYYFLDRILSPERDRRYIDVQDYYNWCAMIQLSTKLESYQMATDEGDFSLTLAPTPHLRIGPFFGWRFAFLGYNLDLKTLFLSNGDTDLGGSIYSAAFGLDLFYRRVGGNFNIKKMEVMDQDYSDLLKGQPFDGVHLGMTRVSFYYVPNYKHYSHQAAFNQTHRQIISAGSLMLGLQYSHNFTEIDWEALTEKIKSINPGITLPESTKNVSEKNDEITATVGYGYNWVFHKDWLLGAEINGGIGYLVKNDNVDSNEKGKSSETTFKTISHQIYNHIALNSTFRFALLYNNGPLYTGFQAVGFYYQHGNSTMVSRNFLGTLYLMVGYNF